MNTTERASPGRSSEEAIVASAHLSVRTARRAPRCGVRRWVSAAALATALVCATVAEAEPGRAAAGRVRVAVLPVMVHAMEDADYLRTGMADMLASRLGQNPSLAIIRVDDAELATSEVGNARSEGEKAKADYVVFGSFTQFGDGASLDIHCAAVATTPGGDDARGIFIQSGKVGDIIPKLDGLSDKLSNYVVSHAGGSLPAVATGPESVLPVASGPGVGDLVERIEAIEAVLFREGVDLAAPTNGSESPDSSE